MSSITGSTVLRVGEIRLVAVGSNRAGDRDSLHGGAVVSSGAALRLHRAPRTVSSRGTIFAAVHRRTTHLVQVGACWAGLLGAATGPQQAKVTFAARAIGDRHPFRTEKASRAGRTGAAGHPCIVVEGSHRTWDFHRGGLRAIPTLGTAVCLGRGSNIHTRRAIQPWGASENRVQMVATGGLPRTIVACQALVA